MDEKQTLDDAEIELETKIARRVDAGESGAGARALEVADLEQRSPHLYKALLGRSMNGTYGIGQQAVARDRSSGKAWHATWGRTVKREGPGEWHVLAGRDEGGVTHWGCMAIAGLHRTVETRQGLTAAALDGTEPVCPRCALIVGLEDPSAPLHT